MDTKVLVTGSHGFLGRAVCKALEAAGFGVIEFDVKNGLSTMNTFDINKAFPDADIIVHAAAMADLYIADENLFDCIDLNVMGTTRVAYACQTMGKYLVYISTCCAYGNQKERDRPTSEMDKEWPTEIYAASKLAGEDIIHGFSASGGLVYTTLRPATFYGPGMRHSLAVYQFLDKAHKGEVLCIDGDGHATRSYAYIDDVVSAIVSACRARPVNRTINVAGVEEISTLDLAKKCVKIASSSSHVDFAPERKGQIRKSWIDISQAKKWLDWEPKVYMDEGLGRTYEWYKEELKDAK